MKKYITFVSLFYILLDMMIEKIIEVMKEVVIVFCLCFFPFSFVYSQSGVDSVCNPDIKNIFKVHDLKTRYETVKYIYKESKNKTSTFSSQDDYYLNHYFEIVTGVPLYSKEHNDSVSRAIFGGPTLEEIWNMSEEEIEARATPVTMMPEDEINRYIERLNCTPEQAHKEYMDFIKSIKLEKEVYLKLIDAELAKSDLSEYMGYVFQDPMSSFSPPMITKLNFLKVFKKFIFDDDYEVLPSVMKISVYLRQPVMIYEPWIIE
jgi:energy-coupling factor transporter ATP-binding protein EcfA2